VKRDVTVFGAGYVGLVTGACLASSGHRVTVLEIDERKLRSLCEGTPPFFEPGLAELLTAGLAAGDLRFEDAHAPRLAGLGEFVFVAVGTPSSAGGAADLRFVRSVMDQIAEQAHPGTVVIMKSTVPPGTGARLAEELVACGVDYVSNPEFLREGAAVTDWFETDRIVLGGKAESVAAVASLYADIDAPVVECDIPSAELIKYASNAFLATKISFANEIARLCDHIGADVTTVTEGVGLDRRIGPAFLNAGIGYGGSCFPKDTRALDFQASMNGYEFNLLKAVIDVNRRQRLLPVIELRAQLSDLVGAPVAVLGLTFKPNTDDVRESPAEEIIGMLLAEGASVTAYDPVGRLALTADGYRQTDTIAEALDGVRAVVITTEWPEFLTAHWPELVSGMADPRLVFDGRNCLDPAALLAAGARYVGVGRR
jgi:UDPglucose 6-dehydrogenase